RLEVSEDFWSQHGQKSEDERFAHHKGYVYCNGFPAGRQAYFAMLEMMAGYRSQVWGNPNWQFQPPTTVEEERQYLKNDMEHIGILFSHSRYAAPFIGGDIQTHAIPKP
ncbi:MAG: hypothetical protein KDK99_07265, partial [Verrucomicrobiales bacterium]|nr:hypothetical protein [Verrucomicrobiales bacterium]